MKTVMLYESMFGNTETLIRAVEHGLLEAGAEDVHLVEVSAATPEDFAGCGLLILAAPTHALGLSSRESRAEAVALGADPERAEVGVREWLELIDRMMPASSPRPAVAVFDTRVVKARHWPGSAATEASRELRHAGFHVGQRSSFFVEGVTGPLAEGEVERASAWGASLYAVGETSGPDR